MTLKGVLNSGFTFDEESVDQLFRFQILNTVMLIAAIFSLLFGLLHDLGINDIGRIHSLVDYFYCGFSLMLMALLRRSKQNYTPCTLAFLAVTLLTFISAMIFVTADEFRLIWFYFAIYIAYVLLGARAGMVMTVAALVAIVICAVQFDLLLSETALITAVLGLLIASLLSRTYTIQMSRYEQRLQDKNRELEDNLEKLNGALQQAQMASHAKSMFLSNMSHEIRTPMNGILGMAQVLRQTQLDEEQLHYLETIDRSGQTLLVLIDELLDLSRIESGRFKLEPKPFDTFRWVLDIQMLTEPLFEQSEVTFTTDVSSELPGWLEGDASRLLQIAVNLVGNASKFTQQGEVKLSIGGELCGSNRYRLRIRVEDSGIGIPADRLEHVFESFQQLSPDRVSNKGVGLGLAISDKLVSTMGGTMQASSVEGEGSHFWLEVELPVVDMQPAERVEVASSGVGAPLRILLVDDDVINRLAVGTLLKQQGHTITEAVDGQDAVAAIERETFDVVLMDVHMPVMDGVAATEAIRASGDQRVSTTPIIGLTASVMSDEREAYLCAGMNAVAEKPIVVDSLMEAIRACTNRSLSA